MNLPNDYRIPFSGDFLSQLHGDLMDVFIEIPMNAQEVKAVNDTLTWLLELKLRRDAT